MKRNTVPSPTTAVISSRRVITKILLNVVDMDLLELEEARGALTAAAEPDINILWYLAPPSVTNPTEEGFRNDASNILGIVQSLRVLLAYLKTRSIPCDWITGRGILVAK